LLDQLVEVHQFSFSVISAAKSATSNQAFEACGSRW